MSNHDPLCPRCKKPPKCKTGDGLFQCSKCGGLYDADPDEGGDYATGKPSHRMEREEAWRQRQAEAAKQARSKPQGPRWKRR